MTALLSRLASENNNFKKFYDSNQQLAEDTMFSDFKLALAHEQSYIDEHMDKLSDIVLHHKQRESDLALLNQALEAEQEYLRLKQQFQPCEHQ